MPPRSKLQAKYFFGTTLATTMKRNGADILDIKGQMRHRNIRSTMKYINFDKESLKRAVDRYMVEF